MQTRNIELPESLAAFIDTEISSGHYADASEVVKEGLRIMEVRRNDERAKLDRLRSAVQVGIDQLNRSEGKLYSSLDDLNRDIDRISQEVAAEVAASRQRA